MGWPVSGFLSLGSQRQLLTVGFSNAVPILTPSGIVLALLSGRPADPDWDVRMESLAHEMDRAKREIGLDDRETIHRRGGYPCVSTGLSLGGGSTVCTLPHVPQPPLTAFRRNPENSDSATLLRSGQFTP